MGIAQVARLFCVGSPCFYRRIVETERPSGLQAIRGADLKSPTGYRPIVVDRAAPRAIHGIPAEGRALGSPPRPGYPGHRPPPIEMGAGEVSMVPHRICGVHGHNIEGVPTARATGRTVEFCSEVSIQSGLSGVLIAHFPQRGPVPRGARADLASRCVGTKGPHRDLSVL
jgi:hypothetical protein